MTQLLDFAILGLLGDGPRHGYELKRALGDLGFWQVSFGSLYPALRRLEKKGHIEAARATGRRKAYQITAGGRVEFHRLVAAPPDPDESERNFQLRIAFFETLEPTQRIRVLEGRRNALSARLLSARKTFKGARVPRANRYRLALMEQRVHSTEYDIAWLDQLIAGERGATS